jgi:hypothetical protein
MQFLCNGLEDDLIMRLTTLHKKKPSELELLESASGKITLMSKLLPKLQREGHKVLIFSQFKIMLDVIEYYLALQRMPMERIDGDTKGVCPPPYLPALQAHLYMHLYRGTKPAAAPCGACPGGPSATRQ